MPQHEPSNGHSVLVAITTRGDRDLDPLLKTLSSQSPTPALRVVLNATTQPVQLLDVCQRHAAELVHEPKRGYATARNAALTSLERFDYLVFFDDDQIPVAGWLEALVRSAIASHATVVFGPVEATVPAWSWCSPADIRPFKCRTDGPYLGEGYSGNTLIRTDFLRGSSLRFDRRYDLSGGEDTDFFRRARGAGATMFFASGACAIERIDVDRLTPMGRLRAGHTAGLRYRHLQGFTIMIAAKKVLRALRGILRLICAAPAQSRRLAGRGLFDLGNAVGYFRGRNIPGIHA